MANNKNMATITLGIVFIGFIASYPFRHTFVGGLVASGCSAALVGGLADWFAISALFRRPLGIPFRTAVIARNRQRIMDAMTDMVEKELLTRENIKSTLYRYDVGNLLANYLALYGGKSHIKELLQKISSDLISELDLSQVGRYFAGNIVGKAAKIPFAPIAAQVLTWSLQQGIFDKLVDFVVGELSLLAAQPRVRIIIEEVLAAAKTGYEANMQQRILAGSILETLGVSAFSIAGLVQQKAAAFLKELQSTEHPLRAALRNKAELFAARLATEPEFQLLVEREKERIMANHPELVEGIGEAINGVLAEFAAVKDRQIVYKWIGTQVEALTAEFRRNSIWQQKLGDLARKALMHSIDSHHGEIGAIVRDRLNQFSTPALVEFLETRVGNDLQMIRINGSVVGGLAGMLIFLLTFWWSL